jgi:hypothetical protein
MPYAVQLTIEDVIQERKRQERMEARSAKDQCRQRKAATAGVPLFPSDSGPDQEAHHG